MDAKVQALLCPEPATIDSNQSVNFKLTKNIIQAASIAGFLALRRAYVGAGRVRIY
jgi:hypothetical protein